MSRRSIRQRNRIAAIPIVAILTGAWWFAPGPSAAPTPPADDSWMNCYAVVAGKACTVDGSVIYAHNEDSGADNPVHFWRVAAQEHQDIETQRLIAGGTEPFAAKTHGFIWCQMPGLRYSDSYFNDHGVAIGTNGCRSRENQPELTDGGITFMLRRIVAARATSARHGVTVATQLLLKYGYADTGRTMVIADGKEAWILNIVRGKHWAAARVPDDKCAVMANHYSIHHVDAQDPANFNLSPGLIEYATKRGWYDSERDGEFDFATVYGTDGARRHGSNIRRAWRGNTLIGDGTYAENWLQPTFVTPKKKLSAADLMAVLRDHYEGTEYDTSSGYTRCSPNRMGATICARGTSFSTVFQLRGDRPPAIGAVMWLAVCRPDASVYVPWYAGMEQVPDGLSRGDPEQALAVHFDPAFKKLGPPPEVAAMRNLARRLSPVYGKFFPGLASARRALETGFHRAQATVEASAERLFGKDQDAAREFLTAYSIGQQARAARVLRRYAVRLPGGSHVGR